MATNSNIEWCDHTVNFWSGCTKVSPACAHCYAEKLAKINRIYGGWGKGAPRSWHGGGAVKSIARWNRKAAKASAGRPRVFINSMSDWLDDEVPVGWLADLLVMIQNTPNLDWLLLTKRPQNWRSRLNSAKHYLQVQQKPLEGARVFRWLSGEGHPPTSGSEPPSRTRNAPTSGSRTCCASRPPSGSCPVSHCLDLLTYRGNSNIRDLARTLTTASIG
jgi:hypothetical protein